MQPKTKHICEKEEELSKIKTKQEVRDEWGRNIVKELGNVSKGVDNLNQYIQNLIKELGKEYVETKVYDSHLKEAKEIKESISILQVAIGNINIKIAAFSGIGAIVGSVGTTMVITFFK